MARQRAYPQMQVPQRVKPANKIVAQDTDEAGCQAALRHQHAARVYGHRANGFCAANVFGEVKVVNTFVRAHAGDGHGTMKRQCVQHGVASRHSAGQRRVIIRQHHLKAQRRQCLHLVFIVVNNNDAVVARLLQQQGCGKTNFSGTENGDGLDAASHALPFV